MADILQSLQTGCGKAADILNNLPAELLSEICHDVLFYLQFKIPAIRVTDLKEKFEQNNVDIQDEELCSIINLLKHIYRSAGQHKIQQTELQRQLSSSLTFSDQSCDCIALSWKEHEEALTKDNFMFDVGKLVDMQWKLGVAVSSDSCKNLNSTFVSMTLKIADNSGKLTAHTFEMTIPQFKNLSKQLQEMAKSMEMV